MHPGLIPYGPWKKEKDLGQGPWDQAWPHKTVYPVIDQWPGNERWFDNRNSPMNLDPAIETGIFQHEDTKSSRYPVEFERHLRVTKLVNPCLSASLCVFVPSC